MIGLMTKRIDGRNKVHGGTGRAVQQPGDRHQGPKVRGVRVEDELWEAVKARAENDGYETVNKAVVELLEAYVGWNTPDRTDAD